MGNDQRTNRKSTLLSQARTQLQNNLLWPLLRDVSRQVKWHVNGSLVFLEPEDWKDIFTAALRKHHRLAEGLDGGFVFLGMRTSKMSKDQMIELIELIYAFGAERGVKWSEDESA